MREYAVVLLAAALVTFLATPVVRVAAVRFRVVAAVRDRDVHVIPTPRGGGVAMYLGIAAGVLVASQLPSLQRSFEFSTQTVAVLVAGGLICLLGVLDDRFGLDALTKLTGQIAAAGVSARGQTDSQTLGSAANLLPLTLPLLVPFAVLFIPFIDLLMAVIRRSRRGQSPFAPDKMHLHHRLLSIGHSHRRAVLIMYFWAALLSFGAVAVSITGGTI